MRLLILTQVYPPEIHPTAVMVDELAGYLAARNWDVRVCAGWPHHPHGRVYEGFRKRLRAVERRRGVEVVRTWHWTNPSRAIPLRGAVLGSQALGNAVAAALSPRADVILVFGPPVVGPVLAAPVARLRQAPLVNVIYDIYPDVAITAGKLRGATVIRAARQMERMQYAASRRIVVLSDGLRDRLAERGVPSERVEVVPIWIDTEEILPGNRDNSWRRALGIGPEKILFLYAGTIGVISGATVVVEAAARLRERRDILFLFVGEGAEKQSVIRRAAELRLDNVRCLPFQPRERLAEVQSAADVGLVTLLPGMGRTSVPSKILGYMAAARPVLASADADCDTGREVLGQQIGLLTPAGDSAALAEAAIRLAEDPALRCKLGANGRRRVVEHYARPANLARFERVLRDVVEGS